MSYKADPAVRAPLPTALALEAIANERKRQDAKWGLQREIPDTLPDFDYAIRDAAYYQQIEQLRAKHSQSSWVDILLEEVAEAVDEALVHNKAALRKELVQVAAVAVNWIENLDRQANGN